MPLTTWPRYIVEWHKRSWRGWLYVCDAKVHLIIKIKKPLLITGFATTTPLIVPQLFSLASHLISLSHSHVSLSKQNLSGLRIGLNIFVEVGTVVKHWTLHREVSDPVPTIWRAVLTFIHWIEDISNWSAHICNWIGDISNWIEDICNWIADISK